MLEAGFRFLNCLVKGGNRTLWTAYFQTVLRFMTYDIPEPAYFHALSIPGTTTHIQKNDILRLPS